jgi:hypothetical protein
MEIKYIAIHHFGPPNPNLNLRQLSNAHKSRWPDFPSKLRPDLFVGYNFIIWKSGEWTQCRYIGEETAAQIGHNFDAVSICLEGDFSKGVKPTPAQQETLKKLVRAIVEGRTAEMGIAIYPGTKRLLIEKRNVLPHRVLQPGHTECYGNSLTNDWAQLICFDTEPIPPKAPLPVQSDGPEITRLQRILAILLELLRLQTMIDKVKLGFGAVPIQCWHDARG